MSDIVDRLQDARAFLSVSDLREIEVCNEAAAEIKRLRANQAGLLNEHEAYEKEIERLTAEYSALQELAAEFVDTWLGDGDGTDLDGLAHRTAEALDRVSGSPDLSKDRQPIDSDTSVDGRE